MFVARFVKNSTTDILKNQILIPSNTILSNLTHEILQKILLECVYRHMQCFENLFGDQAVFQTIPGLTGWTTPPEIYNKYPAVEITIYVLLS